MFFLLACFTYYLSTGLPFSARLSRSALVARASCVYNMCMVYVERKWDTDRKKITCETFISKEKARDSFCRF